MKATSYFQRSVVGAAVVACLWLCANGNVQAHVGPPFPILEDQKVSGYNAAIWADPDIGEAIFYVVLEPLTPNSPSIRQIELAIKPVSGRLPEKMYSVNRQKARGHLRYLATPEFDKQDFWKVRVKIALDDGTEQLLEAEVESTPPGLGRWDLLVYLFPFVLFGGVWSIRFVRKSRLRTAERSTKVDREIAGNRPRVYHESSK